MSTPLTVLWPLKANEAIQILLKLFVEARDYCLIESFHAQCRHWSDVILMEHAQFGRMELGRCVTRNFGHIGCSTDVINQLDVACSGRPSCDFSVSDPSLVRTKPCPKDFTSYLEATYRCVPGMLASLYIYTRV